MWPVNRLTTPVTPADHPNSVHSRYVIEIFGDVLVLSIIFCIFCLYQGFCNGNESDLLFFSV